MTVTDAPPIDVDGLVAGYWRQLAIEAYQRGRDDAYAAGYAQAVADVKAVHHGLHTYLERNSEQGRWTVRGEPRTRATFAQPHPGDYPGRGAA